MTDPQFPLMKSIFDNRLYVAQGVEELPNSVHFRVFRPDETVMYHPLCDDFGPMNLGSTILFIQQLDKELSDHPASRVFYLVDDGRRQLTNAVFMLGSYMLLKLAMPLDDVIENLSWIDDEDVTEMYRDATFCEPTFRLSLPDCWRGLTKGMECGWLRLPQPETPWLWGKIDMEQYAHYDDPLNGDLHEVVPGKLVAFKGPHDLGALTYQDDKSGFRRFSASYYAEVLKDMGVTTVVRLNEPEYDGAAFAREEIGLLDLFFEDCTAPPARLVAAFLAAMGRAGGAVAVHCKAGLGRTGTLIGVYLMRQYGFTAREAMGWLRIMRPGSVIGEQQEYLCAAEKAVRGLAFRALSAAATTGALSSDRVAGAQGERSASVPARLGDEGGEAKRRPAEVRASGGAGAAAAEGLARQVAEGMERRGAARAREGRAVQAAV